MRKQKYRTQPNFKIKIMKKIKIVLTILIVVFLSGAINAQKLSKFEKISIDKAAFDFNCAKEKITVIRKVFYTGGGLIVLNVCDSTVFYECVGTICNQRCNYTPKPTEFNGEGETDGKFHKQVIERATVEFDVAQTDIKQIKHLDGRGQGTYHLFINGNEVIYECMGTVCNLKCQ